VILGRRCPSRFRLVSRVNYFVTTRLLLNAVPVLKDDIRLCGAVCVWLSKEKRPWASGRYIAATWDMEELEGMKEDIVVNDKLKFRMVV